MSDTREWLLFSMVLYSTIEDFSPACFQWRSWQPLLYQTCEADQLVTACAYLYTFSLTNTSAAVSANERALGPGNKFIESILSHSPSGERLYSLSTCTSALPLYFRLHSQHLYISWNCTLKKNHKRICASQFKRCSWLLGIRVKMLNIIFGLQKTKDAAILQKMKQQQSHNKMIH